MEQKEVLLSTHFDLNAYMEKLSTLCLKLSVIHMQGLMKAKDQVATKGIAGFDDFVSRDIDEFRAAVVPMLEDLGSEAVEIYDIGLQDGRSKTCADMISGLRDRIANGSLQDDDGQLGDVLSTIEKRYKKVDEEAFKGKTLQLYKVPPEDVETMEEQARKEFDCDEE